MPLLHGTKPIEYLLAAVLGGLLAVGGGLILLFARDSWGYGLALLLGGAVFAVRFGVEARRRYARRRHVREAVTADRFALVPELAHLPDGDRVTFNDAEGKPSRRGVMQDGKVVFLD